MIPTIRWELNQRKTYLFWWIVCTLVIVTTILLIYPSIHSQATQLNNVLNQLPAALRDLKTGGSAVDVITPIGYLNSQLFYATIPFIQIIMAIGLGGSLVAREEQNHTLELALARPISRGRLLTAKALSGVILVSIVGAVAAVAMIVLTKLVNLEISTAHLLLANLYCSLFSLSFGAIAFTLTAASNLTRRSSVAVATFVSIGGYLLASLSGLSHYIQVPAKLLPYHYYSPTQILAGRVSTGLNVYLVGIGLICIVLSWWGFRRRDIY